MDASTASICPVVASANCKLGGAEDATRPAVAVGELNDTDAFFFPLPGRRRFESSVVEAQASETTSAVEADAAGSGSRFRRFCPAPDEACLPGPLLDPHGHP